MSKSRRPPFSNADKAGVLAEDVRRGAVGKCVGETHPARDLGDDPPVRLGLAGLRQERPLAGDAPLGIGDRAVLLAPCGGGQQDVGAGIHRVVRQHVLGDDEQLELGERLAHVAGARQRDRGVGRHHPQRLDLAARDGLEHLHRLEAFARRDPRRVPEAADAVDVLGHERHVGGELVGEAADLAAAHGVGLAGEGERALAAPADAPGRQMAVDDGVDLVGALRRLVHPLREAGDRIGDGAEQLEEARDIGLRQARGLRGGREVGRDRAGARQRVLETCGMCVDIAIVERVRVGEMHQQPAEQRGVHAGRDAEKQVGVLGGGGAARIDHHDLGAALAPVLDHALEQHRMAPGGVRADEHDEIGGVEIVVGAGHGVGAEGAAMAGHRGRHAQPRIGVNVGRADEALHQLVGDVIVLGQELAGKIERDRVGAVALDDALEAVGDAVERVGPGNAREAAVGLPQHGMEQAFGEAERLAERRALGAEAAAIGGMVAVAGDDGAADVRPAAPAPRSPRRNRGRWCARSAGGAGGVHASATRAR